MGWEKWLVSFPSFGFLMATAPEHVPAIQDHFRTHDVACAAVGEIQADEGLRLAQAGEQARLF